jgi:hypothetical protein
MLAVFCLRLALGMIGSLLLLSPAQVNPRFYRTHFLITLGLTAVAAIFLRETAGPGLGVVLAAGSLLAFAGSVIWSLEQAPGGRVLIGLSIVTLAVCMVLAEKSEGAITESAGQAASAADQRLVGPTGGSSFLVREVSSFTSAALLGTATSAMLLGHMYLIAPGMSIQPLIHLLGGLGIAALLRTVVAGLALWSWTDHHSLANLNDVAVLWLPVRWTLGLIGPLVLGWMAWRTALIRSTQSATGILYVAVIFCFLGELISQLLLRTTGFAL